MYGNVMIYWRGKLFQTAENFGHNLLDKNENGEGGLTQQESPLQYPFSGFSLVCRGPLASSRREPQTFARHRRSTLQLHFEPIPSQSINMPPEIVPSDSDYASEEDSDFAPDAAPAAEVESSESESEADEAASKTQTKPKNKKRKRGDEEEAEDVGFENSGDEAIIKEYEAPKRKKGKKGRAAELEDEGGEGGFVKTRSMRAVEYVISPCQSALIEGTLHWVLTLVVQDCRKEEDLNRHHSSNNRRGCRLERHGIWKTYYSPGHRSYTIN